MGAGGRGDIPIAGGNTKTHDMATGWVMFEQNTNVRNYLVFIRLSWYYYGSKDPKTIRKFTIIVLNNIIQYNRLTYI